MREIFVTEIVKEALGPRGGAFKVLDDSPLSEYILAFYHPSQLRFFLCSFYYLG